MSENFKAPSGPVVHWVFKTASGGTEGALVIKQTAFDAMMEAMMLLKAEKHELTVIQGSKFSVPVALSLPMAESVLLQFPTKKVREKKGKKPREEPKPNGKSNGKSSSNGAPDPKRPLSNRTRTRSA
jgi:hypothetical protein